MISDMVDLFSQQNHFKNTIEEFKTVYYGTVESINKLKNGSLDKISEKSFESLDSSSMSLF